MDITFGWGLDGARWSATAAMGHIRTGPAGLSDILATRLGRALPHRHPALRVAAYRTAIGAADPAWCRASFATDAWSTARRLLELRDELVRSGWDGRRLSADGDRLGALSAVEAHFDDPGAADVLRDVAEDLRDLASRGEPVDIGITSITVLDDRALLPAPWPGILADLERIGVAVAEGPRGGLPRSLHVITAAGEADAAEAAARVLATRPDAGLLATADTALLDQELARRGQARCGRLDPSDQRATAQVAQVFLDAVTAPLDVHAVAALLTLSIAAVEPDTGTNDPDTGTITTLSVVPGAVRSALLHALTREPGIGGPEWTDAVAKLMANPLCAKDADSPQAEAVTELKANPHCAKGPDSPQAEARRTLISELDRMFTDPVPFDDAGADAAELQRRLRWLGERLRRLGGAALGQHGTDELLAATAQVSAAVDVLATFDRISGAELHRVIDDCCVEQPSPLAGAEASARPRWTHPAHVDGGAVVWWTAVDATVARRRIWTDDEVAALAAAGVRPPAPEQLAALDVDAAANGLERAEEIIAILPRGVLGAPVSADPMLLFLADRLRTPDSGPRPDTAAGILGPFTVDAADLVDGGTWRFGDAAVAAPSPDPWRPDDGQMRTLVDRAVTRSITAGPHLLPTTLSFSQIETLLAHRMEWLLGHQLAVQPGWATAIPAGSRMIGTFLHGIVAALVAGAPADRPLRPTGGEVSALFDELLPRYASELSLPGNARLREMVRAEAMESIPGLFGALADAGMHPVAAETEFSFPLTLTLRDPSGVAEPITHEVRVGGYRDLDVEDVAGRPAVVDLKYTRDGTRYRTRITEAQDLQLAVYARSVADGAEGAPALPLAAVATAYFGLKDGVLATGVPDLGGDGVCEPPEAPLPADHGELWEHAVAAIEDALSEIAFGPAVHDVGNELILAARDEGKEHGLSERARALAKSHAMEGRHFPTGPVAFPDYAIITGIEADLS